jgi:GWxTD domain-containing protein
MTDLVGMTLVHFIWQGAAIALVLAALLRFARDARIRYGMACAAMSAMLVSVAVTLAVLWPDRVVTVRPIALFNSPVTVGVGSPNPDRTPDVLPYLVAIWIAGALCVGLYRFGGWVLAARMRRLARRIGEFHAVALLESALTEVPVVIGVLRPAILVPLGMLSGLPPSQVEAILLHELAHIRRFDYLVNLVQTAVESLLFYHPAVWWVSHVIRDEREKCCDDAVVASQSDAREYAAALLSLEQWRGREPALAATGGDLVRRIRRILNQPEDRQGAGAVAVAMALLLGAFCAGAIAQQSQSSVDDHKQLVTPYTKWVNEDAVYIINPREREAFLKLQTDEEREKFIEEFWARRNPIPGSRENKFKQEHYRRIAYANDRYPGPDIPGWKTDRGRIYILYGPPDEIEDHPLVSQWLYYLIQGIGKNVVIEFVDAKGNGDYRMTPDPWKSLDLPVRPKAK